MSIKNAAKKRTKRTFAPFEHSFSVEEEVSGFCWDTLTEKFSSLKVIGGGDVG